MRAWTLTCYARAVLERFGKYELLRKLSTGGLAEAFLARPASPLGFEKGLLLKRVHPKLMAVPGFPGRLLSEVERAARLDHPHLTRLFDWGEDAGTFFVTREYVQGVSLREICQAAKLQHQTLAPGFCAQVVADACEAVGHAHGQASHAPGPGGFLHRDLAPENVFVSQQGSVKVVDFGWGRALDEQPSHARPGRMRYQSPEQLHLEPLDDRSDVYALGVLLYELLTLATPWDHASTEGERIALRPKQGLPVTAPQTDFPAPLSLILERALASKERRYARCDELHEALHGFLATHGGTLNARRLIREVEARGLFADVSQATVEPSLDLDSTRVASVSEIQVLARESIPSGPYGVAPSRHGMEAALPSAALPSSDGLPVDDGDDPSVPFHSPSRGTPSASATPPGGGPTSPAAQGPTGSGGFTLPSHTLPSQTFFSYTLPSHPFPSTTFPGALPGSAVVPVPTSSGGFTLPSLTLGPPPDTSSNPSHVTGSILDGLTLLREPPPEASAETPLPQRAPLAETRIAIETLDPEPSGSSTAQPPTAQPPFDEFTLHQATQELVEFRPRFPEELATQVRVRNPTLEWKAREGQKLPADPPPTAARSRSLPARPPAHRTARPSQGRGASKEFEATRTGSSTLAVAALVALIVGATTYAVLRGVAPPPLPPSPLTVRPLAPAPPQETPRIRPSPARARVQLTTPLPATVTVNGVAKGSTPLQLEDLPALEPLRVEISNATLGFRKALLVELEPGENGTKELPLRKLPVELRLKPRAHVFLDGVDLGEMENARLELYEGWHKLQAFSRRGKPLTENFIVLPQQANRFSYELSP